MPELRRFAPNVPIVLVGTKLGTFLIFFALNFFPLLILLYVVVCVLEDLRDDKGYLADHTNVITSTQGEELRKQIGAAAYIECSSKTQQVKLSSFLQKDIENIFFC